MPALVIVTKYKFCSTDQAKREVVEQANRRMIEWLKSSGGQDGKCSMMSAVVDCEDGYTLTSVYPEAGKFLELLG